MTRLTFIRTGAPSTYRLKVGGAEVGMVKKVGGSWHGYVRVGGRYAPASTTRTRATREAVAWDVLEAWNELQAEKTPDDAPIHYTSEEAHAWAAGYNTALRDAGDASNTGGV